MVLDGRKIAEELIRELSEKSKIERFFAAFLVGENTASESFVKQKAKVAATLGVDFRIYRLEERLSGEELREEVRKIADNESCGGVLVQLPLPSGVDSQYVLDAIPQDKDPDVLGEQALGAFYAGRNKVLPPAVATVEEILKKFPMDLADSVVAVVGAGKLIGKPVGAWLSGRCKELIILKEGNDLADLKKADLVILGTGKPGLVRPEILKDGAGVIDFGYSKNNEGKTSGDLDVLGAISDDARLAFYTPTPGGTGPILVAKLFENFYKLNQR